MHFYHCLVVCCPAGPLNKYGLHEFIITINSNDHGVEEGWGEVGSVYVLVTYTTLISSAVYEEYLKGMGWCVLSRIILVVSLWGSVNSLL